MADELMNAWAKKLLATVAPGGSDQRSLEDKAAEAAARAALKAIHNRQRAVGVANSPLARTSVKRDKKGSWTVGMTNRGAVLLEDNTRPRLIPSGGPVRRGAPLAARQKVRKRSMKRNPYRKAMILKGGSAGHPISKPVMHPGTKGKKTFTTGLRLAEPAMRAAVDREMSAPLRKMLNIS